MESSKELGTSLEGVMGVGLRDVERVAEVGEHVERYGIRIDGSKVVMVYLEQYWPDSGSYKVFIISFAHRDPPDPREKFIDTHISIKQRNQAGYAAFEVRLPIYIRALELLLGVDEDSVEDRVKGFIDYLRHYVSRTADIYLSL